MNRDVKFSDIQKKEQNWQQNIVEPFKKTPGYRPEAITPSGIPVKLLYTPLDVKGMDYLSDLGFPGSYPNTRGVFPTMYRGRLWAMRNIVGWGSPAATRERLKTLMEHGETALNFHPDLPCGVGYDSDDPMARGQVGVVGTPINTLEDIEETFDGIPIDKVAVSLIENATAPIILAMYVAMAEKRGLSIASLPGTIQNDMLKEYEFTGTGYMVEPEGAMKMSLDIIEYCTKYMPRWNPITFCAYVARDHGMDAVAELGHSFANAKWIIRECIRRGLDVNEFAPRFSFFGAAGINLFEEVAKFRAARRMWAKMLREEFKATNPRALALRLSCSTDGATLTAEQPYNNLARLTLETLAAVLGGLQSINTASMDEALSIPTEKAMMLSLRIQQIIAYESGVADTVDPLAGSYYVEYLTNTLEEKAWKFVDDIEKQGGALAAIKSGWFEQERRRAEVKWVDEIEQGKRTLVGVNTFRIAETDELPVEVFRGGATYEEEMRQKLARFRQERDNRKVQSALESIRGAIKRDENLIPVFIDAVKASATLGEISKVLKECYGKYRPRFV